MFRIEAFVEDKNIAKVLHGLSGLVLNLSTVPVVNAKATNGKIVAETDGGSMTELFLDHLSKKKIKEFKAVDAKNFIASLGRSPKSYSYVLKQCLANGVLKRQGKGAGTKYVVKGEL